MVYNKINMIENIINNLIKEEYRQEAINILNLSNNNEKKDFFHYYDNKKYNICCLLIDTIKDRLIGENKISKGGYFGNLLNKLY